MKPVSLTIAALLTLALSPAVAAQGDPARGNTLYHVTYKCTDCHDTSPTGKFANVGSKVDTLLDIVLNQLDMSRLYFPALYNNSVDIADLAAYLHQAFIAPPAATTTTVVEYHHAIFDHYFITPVAAEIALLDAKTPPFQDWSRTGFSFKVYVNAGAPAASVAICRFFNDHFAPKSTHFYAPHGLGCEDTITKFPDWTLEDDKLFNALLPDASGACPAPTIPVYRLYNNGMGGAPNHRFVTSLAERQNMLNKGYVAEGAGIGVGMCVPG